MSSRRLMYLADGRDRYPVRHRLLKTQVVKGQPEERQTNVRYDAQGRVVAELSAVGAALITATSTPAQVEAIWTQYATVHTLDASGQRIASRDPNGNRTVYFYDGEGRVRYSVNGAGEVTALAYDAFGAPAGVRNLLPSPRLHDFLKFEPQFSAGLDAIHRRFR